MKKSGPLFLHEEVLLLALRDEDGVIAGGTSWRFALGGAALAEFLLTKRIRVDESGKRPMIEVASAKPLGDPFLDECLARVSDAKRRAAPATWVSRFANAKQLKHRIAEGLVRRGILRESEDKVLLLFTRRVYPERDPRIERAVIERLRKAIFTEAHDLDPRTVVLIALGNQTGLLKATFDRKKLKARKKRIAAIVAGDAAADATRAAIAAMLAAIAVAVAVPIVVTS